MTGQALQPGLNLTVPASTGSRLNLTPLETPASVDIIPRETIVDRGQTNVIDAITQNATGITSIAAPGNGGSALVSRGFAGHGSVMQLYDGTRLYVGAGTVTFPFDTWTVDRIEVLRGPASVLYGEGAIGGVINVVPKKPTSTRQNEAMASWDSFGTWRAAIGSGGPIDETLSYRLDAVGSRSDGWLDENGEFSNAAVSGAIRWQPRSDLSFTLSNDYGYREPLRYFGTPLIGGRLDESVRFRNYNVGDSAISYEDNWTQLKAEWALSDSVTLRNTAYRLTTHRHWKDVETYAWDQATGSIKRSSYIEIVHDEEQWGNRADATFKGHLFGLKNELVVGAEANVITFKHTNNSPYGGTSTVNPWVFDPGLFVNLAGTYPRYESDTRQYAVFAEDRLVLTDRLSIIGGLRHEAPTVRRDDLVAGTSFEREFSATTWRTGAVYEAIPGLALYAQYATGVDPIGNVISTSVAQKDYQMSTGRQVEAGVKQSFWEGRGEWTLAAYHIVKNNLLTADINNPTVSVQVGEQSSRGIEASMALRLPHGWRIEANGTVLKAQYDDFSEAVSGVSVSRAGNRPVNVPNSSANAWVTWAFLPGWEARAGVQYVGARYADAANLYLLPEYHVVNAGIDYKPRDNVKLSLRLYNLLDEVYAVTGKGTTAWVLGSPRAAEVSLRITF
ncbi:TonB-dependent receptor [Rhodoplanes sp. TEM]|uniref:TonB-dependent receptor n=1 Tax=Rhodoplanes tepidamans TaxID=200616 RepID=A0ABT5JCK4_RHOTP|nr:MULTISPECIES: TonB-dependent receptor [Rhodoplanes]MDC7787101.1 TonB-dependent receptor [Rhodoplanes tepidamans]MDC7987872.1 TonB-dependent receptor [Rhodoplanes sp. TEM]MDQ0358701.1 iron complex outermembrane receptor protein [Rhodoplanes tepidamans]